MTKVPKYWIKAKKYRERILSLAKQNFGLDHSETVFALNALGKLHYSLGEYEKAEPLLKQSLEINKKIFGFGRTLVMPLVNYY